MSSIVTPAGPSTKSESAQLAVAAPSVGSDPDLDPQFEERLTIGGVRLPRLGTIVLALVAIALALRLWELGARPFHHDESLDAWWSWRFRTGIVDPYDPVYHGPLRFFVTAGLYEVFGETDAVARLFSALTGAAAVGLPWFLRRDLGRIGTIAAAVALTVSPTMLYYSRFGREDAQMVFLTLLAMVLGLAYLRKPRIATATGLTFTLACSFAIKESTYLFTLLLVVFLLIMIAAQFDAQNRVDLGLESDPSSLNPAFISSALLFASAGLTVAVVIGAASGQLFPLIALYMAGLIAFTGAAALPQLRKREANPDFEWPGIMGAFAAIGWAGWAIAMGVFAVAWLAFFTIWFKIPGDWHTGFTEAINYWDSQQEVNRGGQPWYYYLYALPAYEWLFVGLAVVGAWRGLRRPTMMSVLMVWFAVGSMILYSYAGERMPWLIAHPLLPMLILAGLGTQVLWQERSRAAMPAIAVFVGLGLIFTTFTSVRASFNNGADGREILSQAGQATPHLTAALDRLENIDEIAMRETGQPARLAIHSTNAWPYSWYLRNRGDVTWFSDVNSLFIDGAMDPSIDVIIIDRNAIAPDTLPDYQATLFAMRSWWVPTYNDAGPIGWIKYARDRSLWEQNPNPNYAGVSEATEEEAGGIGERISQLGQGAQNGVSGWVGFASADGATIPAPADPNASTSVDDGRDGCGSVDQWFLVHNRFAFTEGNVYPGPIAEMNELLPCASDTLSEPAF